MDISVVLVTIAGLCMFEIISSIDNAIINAEVISTMQEKFKRWFLTWGLFIAVFLVRGLLPLLLVWISSPNLTIWEAFTAMFSSSPEVAEAIETSAPILLIGGGVFLVFLFFHWLFLEEKSFGLTGERVIQSMGVWFYAVVSIILLVLVWLTLQKNPLMAFAAVMGSTAFFVVMGFRQNAEKQEQQMIKGNMSDVSKLMYLEIIDATFSIDGVIGAFAFTMSVPLILIGNTIGAIIVRQLTIGNIDRIKKYVFLKNGAMYSILFLGLIMIGDSFGLETPPMTAPLITFVIVGFFLLKSIHFNKQGKIPL